jgi:hypothetical protein
MIGYWHVVGADETRHALIALGARLGGYELVVERCGVEPCWHWMVLSRQGHEIEGGTAPSAHTAEEMAEEAAFHIHPPSEGDWVGRLI